MTRQKKNRIRGLILLVVFSLNTLAGFACSLGVEMGYNKEHHKHDDSHAVSASQQHAVKHQHEHNLVVLSSYKNISNEDRQADCCSNGVTDFSKLDKSIAGSTDLKPSVFLVAFASGFLLPTQEPSLLKTPPFGSVRRSWHLPDDTDLRIVIQSFQI